MAYTINLTDGAVFAVIPDGTVNTSSSMVLVGKNYAGYGEFLDENFIHLLENSSNTTAPSSPLTGQLWWDKTNNVMQVWNGSSWRTVSAAAAAASAPTGNATGDLWFDTTNKQLNVWTGTAWLVVGPAYTSTQGLSGAIALTINDVGFNPHTVTGIYAANTLVSIVSPDSSFVPVAPYSTAFPTIFRGTTVYNTGATGGNIVNAGNVNVTAGGTTTLVVTSTGANVTGYNTVSGNITGGNISTAGNVAASYYLGNGSQLSGVVATSVGVLASLSVTGNTTTGNLNTGGSVSATGNILAAGYFIGDGSFLTNINAGNISGTYGNANVVTLMANFGSNVISTTGTVTVGAIDHTGSNGVGNIGSSTSYFNRVFATATTALYADVAERFAADEVLEAGTVVELGGPAEITKSQQELSDKVFGVISTRAAYLMNGGAGTNDTHPPVAMTGRVPVKVIGAVKKGDRLVSAGNGMARAAQPNEATAFNVIGRSLVDKPSTDYGTIEAIVTIKN